MKYNFWFIVGSQFLYGNEVLETVEKRSKEMAEKLGVEIRFFDQEELLVQIEQHGLSTSNFVEANVGVGNVAEASALCCVENGQILMRKMRYGKATVALIWER